MSENGHSVNRRDFLKLAGLSASSLVFAPEIKFLSKETGENPVLTEKQRQDLISASLKYIAKNTPEAIKIAQAIDYRENNEYEPPKDMCGPLSIAILRDAGLLSVGADTSDFWLADPVESGEIFKQTFPKKMYEWVRIEKPIDKIDYKENPLKAGDFVFICAGKYGDCGHMLVVNRVDKAGRAFSVNNFTADNGAIIDEVMLYDPNRPGIGKVYDWPDLKNKNKKKLTGFGGYFLWRLLCRQIGTNPLAMKNYTRNWKQLRKNPRAIGVFWCKKWVGKHSTLTGRIKS
jgi:hypothetical protein